MKMLVGYTGFVGSNINEKMMFDEVYNSKNITEAYGKKPELLVYSGIRAEKFFADNNPEEDMENINAAIKNIESIQPKKLVLISTVDVYANPNNVNEDFQIKADELSPYGKNRYLLEQTLMRKYPDMLIVRLPALFGINLKKNFIYDYIHFIPSLLNEQKYNELKSKNKLIEKYYHYEKNGFYRCYFNSVEEQKILKELFQQLNFSALSFTDSRSVFQFYNLKYLAKHIQIALENNINVLNIATEPVSAAEVYTFLTKQEFSNQTGKVFNYNFKTKYDEIFNGHNGYIFGKQQVLAEIKQFIEESINDENSNI